tara:strand:- start:1426 stop:2625 length:1200 start_codon:yes stop_codon:yes gene_type:complete
MKVKNTDINDIKPYDKNPRNNANSIDRVADSISEFGFRQPIVVDEDMVVLAGHTRLIASKQLGLKKVPVHIADGLTNAQKKAYRIMDNKSSEDSEWDQDLLALELKDLIEDNYDLNMTGFTPEQIDALSVLAESVLDGKTDEDDIPETPKEPKSKLGDIYELGHHRLMCGDSTHFESVDSLMQGKKADMVLTDPPYGIDFSGGRTQTVAKKEYGKIMNDNLGSSDTGDLIQNIWSFHKKDADIYICVSPKNQKPFLDAIEKSGNKVDHVIVWDKKYIGLGYMSIRRQCEFILMINNKPFKKGDKSENDLWSIGRDNLKEYQHGTQKPVALPQKAIEHSSKKMELVLDLFGGSGSTLLACEKTKRKARIMELDPMFADVIVKRWENFTGKKAKLINGRNT